MVTPSSQPAEREAEQAVHELAMSQVSDVMLNLEHSLARAKKALKTVDHVSEPNIHHALTDAVRDLERLRKRLMKDTYYAGDSLRLI